MKSHLLQRRVKLLAPVVLLVVSTVILFANLHTVLAFIVNRFTGYEISWAGCHGNPFSKSSMETLAFRMPDTGMTLHAASADLLFRKSDFFEKKGLAWDILLKDVVFTRDPGRGNAPIANPILSVPFDSGWKYSKMAFTVEMDGSSVRVAGFDADSENIRLTGAMELARKHGDISIELRIYVSPDVAEEKMGGFKDMLLQEEENGWYGSSFHIEGNLHDEVYSINSDHIQVNFREIK
jgi:hypothetical protein